MGFDGICNLLKIDALDVSLLRCFTLCMISETKAHGLPVGFIDPETMSLSTITCDKSYVVDYLTKALMKQFVKDCIMFAHDTGDQWILVVLIPRWGKVLYFDSMRSEKRDHSLLKDVINEAYLSICRLKKCEEKLLVHVTKFPCHQQPLGNTSGFYTANHMLEAMRILDVENPKDFEVSTTPLNTDELVNIQEKIASFIMDQVISSKGDHHYQNPRVTAN